uniref:Uncharacterized protein n=1 Tax=viral metagenome TaxID=1070528 RepID=A0A6M3KHM9_9ZZZZ
MATTKDSPDLQLDYVEIVEPRLWMSSSYQNTYVASTPTAKFDVSNPVANFFDCGTIAAVRLPMTKDVVDYMRGVPKTSRKQWEISRTAQITFNTANLAPHVKALISGETIFNTCGSAAASAEHVASLYTDGSRRRKYLKLGKKVNPGFNQYDVVVVGSDTNASNKSSYNLGVVESHAASLVTLADAGLSADPVAGDLVRKVRSVEMIGALGTDIQRSAILFWDVITSGSSSMTQYAVYYPKLKNFSGGEIDMKDASEPYDMAITLSAQSVMMTFGDGSTGYNFFKKWLLNF